MNLREESLTGENMEKDVTLNEESVAQSAESVTEKTEETSEVVNLAEEATDEMSEKTQAIYSTLSKGELIDALKALLNEPIDTVRDAVAQI